MIKNMKNPRKSKKLKKMKKMITKFFLKKKMKDTKKTTKPT